MAAIGVLNGDWVADVAPDGSVIFEDRTVHFAIAAEDRWHLLSAEPSVRQRLVGGTPVIETRVRVPKGDVVLVAYGAADGDGAVVVEIINESSLAVAIACSDPRVVSSRPATSVAVEGVALPPESVLFPLGHTMTLRLGLPVRAGAMLNPGTFVPSERVVNGWTRQCEAGTRYGLGELDETVTLARCQVLLRGVGEPLDDVVGSLCSIGELTRMGHDPFDPGNDWVPDLASLCMTAARRERTQPLTRAALTGAAVLFDRVGEWRAGTDVRAMADALDVIDVVEPDVHVDPRRWLTWLYSTLVDDRSDGVALWNRWPDRWLGRNVQFNDMPSRHGRVSAAVRWHGERPALLWECERAVHITCPGLDPSWSDDRAAGDTLLASDRAGLQVL